MARSESVGVFEQLVLTAVARLGADAYGVTVRSRVEQLTRPRKVSLGAVYVTLDRLEEKGLIVSRMSDPTPERGGRGKRCYRLERTGERMLQESAITAKRLWDTVVSAWGENWVTEGRHR
jgi:DNA-binding PadR family transcriptional regulator